MRRRNPWEDANILPEWESAEDIGWAPVRPAPVVSEPEGGADGTAFTGLRPTDITFSNQWHLSSTRGADINLRNVWADFTGRGISVAVIDDGFDYNHADLRANYDRSRDYDWRMRDDDALFTTADRHGTAVMGVIGADQNGIGTVGIAHDATLAGLRIGYGSAGNPAQYANALRDAARFDIANNSWGYSSFFSDNFNSVSFASSEAALIHGAGAGRGGLGTVYVFAAGNSRSSGDNVNHHNYQNSIYTIAVGATDSAGKIASFSTPGAPILVSAPGVGIVTTDITGGSGYAGGDTATVSGTSFAAPAVSGVVALMLDANAKLGWRDVQEILAYSARQTDTASWTWKWNGAKDFNGGALHTSTDYGFGLVDAHAAVRLAETWTQQSTSANMVKAAATATPNRALTDNGITTSTVTISQDLRIDQIEMFLDLRHTWRGDLKISLISPTGTESILIDRPGIAPGRTGYGDSSDNIIFDLTSTQFWSESSKGTWTLKVHDMAPSATGTLVSWTLNVLGDNASADNTYVYTDEYAKLGTNAARRTLNDSAGTDAINAAAVTTNSVIDLVSGATIAGQAVAFAPGTVIERAFGGDGADIIRGNASNNWIWGGRGNDLLAGRGGADSFLFGVASGADVIEDFEAADEIWLTGGVTLAGLSDTIAVLSDGATITAANGWAWSLSDFVVRDALIG